MERKVKSIEFWNSVLSPLPKIRTIVVEGLNGTGKTTLCQRLSQYYKDNVVKHDDRKVEEVDAIKHDDHKVEEVGFKKGYIVRMQAPRTEGLIMDRSPITEYVYGTVLRDKSEVSREDIVDILPLLNKPEKLNYYI